MYSPVRLQTLPLLVELREQQVEMGLLMDRPLPNGLQQT